MSEPNGFLGLMSHPGASSRLQLDNAVNLLQEMRIDIIIKLSGKIKTPRQIDTTLKYITQQVFCPNVDADV